MIRGRVGPVCAAVVLALLCAVPASAENDATPDYFPLHEGDTWRYRSTMPDGQTSEFTLTVVSAESTVDGVRGCIEFANPKPAVRNCYRKTPSAVLLFDEEKLGGAGKAAAHPPRPLLKLPLRPETRWGWRGVFSSPGPIIESNEVFPSESVETPAGRFDAVKVETRIGSQGETAVRTSWFAPDVGLVKQRTERAGFSANIELLEYHVATEK